MNKKEKKIFIIVSIVLVFIFILLNSLRFDGLSVATDSSPTSSRLLNTFTVAGGGMCADCPYQCQEYGDYATCCEDSGWTPAPDGCDPPNQGDCSNDPSKKYDCSNSCNSGEIYAYNFDKCCDAQHPFTPDGQFCHTTPQPNSDNYYTRHSECTSTSQTKCQGENLYQCTESPQFIYKYSNKGQVTGQCGIECNTLSDCSGNLPNCQTTQTCDFSCGGNECIPVGSSTYYRLSNNQCDSLSLKPSEVTTNDYTTLQICQTHIIETPTTYFRFEDNKCSEITLLPSQKTSIDYTSKDLCDVNIKGMNWELIIGIIVILGILGFVIYRYKGKGRSK